MEVYKCLNCGFIFRIPVVVYRKKPLNPGEVYAIHPAGLYFPIATCPKCGSDAIKKIKIKDEEEKEDIYMGAGTTD